MTYAAATAIFASSSPFRNATRNASTTFGSKSLPLPSTMMSLASKGDIALRYGRSLVSAGYDLAVRIWPLSSGAPTITTLPSPLNAAAVARDGEIAAGSADGRVFFLSPKGELRGEVAAGETPIIALAVSNDGALVAAAGIRGSVAVIERATRKVVRTLVGPGLPVWSAALSPNPLEADSRSFATPS